MECEDALCIKMPDTRVSQVKTVGDLHDLCVDLIEDEFGTKPLHIDRERYIWERICKIVSEQLGVEPELVTPDARFIDDLGMD